MRIASPGYAGNPACVRARKIQKHFEPKMKMLPFSQVRRDRMLIGHFFARTSGHGHSSSLEQPASRPGAGSLHIVAAPLAEGVGRANLPGAELPGHRAGLNLRAWP